jgi:predicted dehydrogenase
MDRIRSAVIGVGFIGVAHIEALRRLGFVDIIALCDPVDAERKASELYIPGHFSDYKEMIQSLELDFVHICTPNFTHFPIASFAISHGVNVVLEKPMTVSIEEGRQLADLAKKHNVVAAVNFHNRFYPATHALKERIAAGELGKIISVSGSYMQDWLLYDNDYSWRLESDKSGTTRAVADIGSHWIDLVEYVSGLKVTEVLADFSTVYPVRKKPKGQSLTFSNSSDQDYDEIPIDTEDMASLLIRFENGAKGCCFISQMFAGKKNKIQLYVGGTESSAEWDLDDLSNLIIGHRNRPNEVLTKDAVLMGGSTADLISFPSGHAEGFPDAFKQGFKQIYQKFKNPELECVFADFEAGLREMIICERIHESARSGKFTAIKE